MNWSAPRPWSLSSFSNFRERGFRLVLTSLLDALFSAPHKECQHKDNYGCTSCEERKHSKDVVF
jgi:hypothetical protein